MRTSLFLLFGLVFGLQVNAQRFGLVDSELILTKIPEYNQAQKQLDQLSRNWEAEVEKLLNEADALQKLFNAEKVLMTEDMQKEKLQEIKDKKEEARELQRKYFGPDGELFKKRVALVKPIQDKIFNAVQEVARRRKLDAVFDKGSELIILYDSGRADISDEVMKKLGI